jgi:hypothetical protein
MDIPLFPNKSVSEDFTIIYDVPLFINEFESYIDQQVIGEIKKAIKNNMGAAAYILISCAIDCLASFWSNEDSTGSIYKAFIDEFFDGYNAEHLYKDLRCKLVHNYTLGENIIMCWGEASIHKSRTSKGDTIINLEQFFEDFEKAKNRYFERVRLDRQLQVNLANRWLSDGILSPIQPDTLTSETGNGVS